MRGLSSAARSQSPKSMLTIYLCVVVVTALVAIGSVLYTSSEVDERSQTATEQADSAVLAAEIQTDVRAPLGLLFANAYAFMSMDTSLPPQARQALLAEIMANLNTPSPVISVKFPGVVIPMSEKDTFTLQRDMEMISRKVEALSGRSASVELSAVTQELSRAKSAMDGYVETKSADSFRQMFASTVALGARLGDAGDGYAFSLRLTEASLGEATRIARLTMVGAL